MKPNYQTSLCLNEKDFNLKEKLRKSGVSIIETWRRGAEIVRKEKRIRLDK